MKKTARLLVTYDCPRDCKGCCNKDWKYDPPTVVKMEDLWNYSEVCITGGEPMLYPDDLMDLIRNIRWAEHAPKVILYTASVYGLPYLLPALDGLTLTLHDDIGVQVFNDFAYNYYDMLQKDPATKRLNVFTEDISQDVKAMYRSMFFYDERTWIKNCPLPKHEDFVRLPQLFGEKGE